MTTNCSACGATRGPEPFCGVCGTPDEAGGALAARLEGTTRPELYEHTRSDLLPGPAGHPEPTIASAGRRAGAYLLDMLSLAVTTSILVLPVAAATGLWRSLAALRQATTPTGTRLAADEVASAALVTGIVAGVVAVLGLAALAVWEGRTGSTVGNRVLGTRTTDADRHTPIGVPRALLRWLVTQACGLVPLIGTVLVLASPAFDSSPRRQGWQDRAARSVVTTTVAPRPARSAARVVGTRDVAPVAESAAAQRLAESLFGTSAPPRSAGSPVPAARPGEVISAVPGVQPSEARGGAGDPAPARAVPSTPVRTAAPTPDRQVSVPGEPAASSAPRNDVPVQLDEELESTRFSVSSRRSDGTAVDGHRTVSVVLDDGRQLRVEGRVLVGREPRQDAASQAVLLAVTDPTRSVSATHAELLPSGRGLRVTDVGSTNGSAAIAPDGTVHELTRGAGLEVEPGWVVQLGDRRLTLVATIEGR